MLTVNEVNKIFMMQWFGEITSFQKSFILCCTKHKVCEMNPKDHFFRDSLTQKKNFCIGVAKKVSGEW